MKNKVFIATSLEGHIADAEGGIEWLESFPELNEVDTGWSTFMEDIDALVMGRNTYEKVLSFGIDWPYDKPVYVLSTSLNEVPLELKGKVFLVGSKQKDLKTILDDIHKNGHLNLYIDGGRTIQSFLREDLIDELTITTIPVLLGKGIPLFGNLDRQLRFECRRSLVYIDKVVQSHFVRKRD